MTPAESTKWIKLSICNPPLLPLVLYLVCGLVFAVLGGGMFPFAKWLEKTNEWLSALLQLPMLVLFFLSFACFFVMGETLLVLALGYFNCYARVLIIPDDGLWLSNGTRFLGQSSIHIPFTSIEHVNTKWTERGVEHIQIVYGPDHKTEFVDMISSADFERLLVILKGICPHAFVEDPLSSLARHRHPTD
jgi:hypothetical protein